MVIETRRVIGSVHIFKTSITFLLVYHLLLTVLYFSSDGYSCQSDAILAAHAHIPLK